MQKIAILVSGGGTNLGALIQAQAAGRIPSGKIALVLSSSEKAYALTRAKENGIPTEVVRRGDVASAQAFDAAIRAVLEQYSIDVVVLAGFMSILGEELVRRYERRMINVHPSLIPSFCGKGYYGLRVHRAALDYGVKVTGATVHYVSEIPDAGEIILQKAVDVLAGDTPEALQRRVMEEAEWVLLPQAVQLVCERLESERKKG